MDFSNYRAGRAADRSAATAPAAPPPAAEEPTGPKLELVTFPSRRRFEPENIYKAREEEEEVAPEHEPPKTLTALRPQDMSEMVGQHELVSQLKIVVKGAQIRQTTIPHVLLSGPAGHGKTTLAGIIANICGGTLVKSSGMALQKPEDLAGILLRLVPNTVLFIDEVHRLPIAVMETLYSALEDGEITTLIGSGKSTRAMATKLPRFTCVAATTKPGSLSTPFRDRFGFHGTVVHYSVDELAEIVDRAWARMGIAAAEGEGFEVAKRCKGVPRLALHLAERVLDYCAVAGATGVPENHAGEALEAFGVDERGLTSQDWRVLDALVNRFAGRPVGLDALASAIDVDKETLSNEIEPPLVHSNLIERTARGRMALPEAYELFRKDA